MFSSPPGTKMFQFPGFASPNKKTGIAAKRRLGCPIRKPRGQRLFAPRPGLSQLITSFIASVSQGIHRPPLYSFANWRSAQHTTPPAMTTHRNTGDDTRRGARRRPLILSAELSTECLRRIPKPQGKNTRDGTLKRLNCSLACHNMSKISVRHTARNALPATHSRARGGEVENNGFEPLTPCLQSRCSSQLS